MRSPLPVLLAAALFLPPFLLSGAACSSTTTITTTATDPDAAVDEDAGEPDPTVDGGKKDTGVDAGPFTPAPHPPYPQVPKLGNAIITNMRLVTITVPGDPLAAGYNAFGDFMVGSTWLKTLAVEYGLGTTFTNTNVTGAATIGSGGSVSSAGMKSYIANAISGKNLAPNGHTIYMLYLPEGVGESTDPTCQQFGGYHDVYSQSGAGNDGWAFAQHCASPGLSKLQWMTSAASHEIIEAATDVVPGQGWTFPTTSNPTTQTAWALLLGELGDLCVNTQTIDSGNVMTRVWSNAGAKTQGDPCGPALKDPFYNVSVPKDWYPVTSGGTVTIPITGYSTARVEDWAVQATVTKATQAGWSGALASATTIKAGGQTIATINNGRTATLTITAPSAPKGSYASVYIASQSLTTSLGDPYHLWPVGVYIP
jgi:hypothetical protein